ncbi:unnamed protein product [Didymodactylos carnosus]|uniref:ATP-dependent RNA helicase n=1 Tax=Didymodactylos carnosus TaxID=1234261 RepID=A0A8S2IS14_9BILA|nr:unnamed protein product [Didymodactylos carnosus]CAF3769300.1 unnamed protein product [Didymodactylos carnosus]
MNYRRIYVDIDCKYIGTVTANLHKFTFANDEKTILGFIRWIPKFISNTSSNKNTIKELDDFQSVSDENDEFDLNMMTVEDEADDDDDDSNTDKPSQSAKLIINNGTWVITDIMNPDIPEENELGSPLLTGITTMTIIPDEPGTFNDYVSDRANKPANSQEKIEIKDAPVASNNVQQAAATVAAKTTLEIENEQLRVKMTTLEQQINEQLTNFDELSAANQQKLGATMTELDRIHQVLDRKENQEKMINETAKKISIIEYTLPQSSQLVLLKLSLIIKILKTLDYPHKQYFIDSVPIVEISDRNNCTLILKGFLVHHQQLKAILDRLQALFTVVQSAQDYYQRELNKSVRQILRIIGRVHSTRLTNWKHYSTSLIKLIHQKLDEYTHNFNQYINDQSKLLIDGYIESRLQPPLKEMEKLTNDYMKKKQLLTDIETLKHQALDEFVRDHILVQQNSSKSVPKKESILTLNKHIDKIKTLLKTNSSYNGCELKHFQMIVPLLQRIMIFYHCFLLQLPLFDASVDLMDKIDKNTVLTITTATGSGKSTLLPALLVAEGYDKIIVTQPRRLPCNLISQRVNTMIDSDISGWAVSGAEKNVQAKILYLTDGLLKERLLNDENLITKNTQLSKYVIFFMDEVHERSVNIDLCLGLFARLLTIKPELKTKMKLIISSATLDASVPKLYRQIPNCALSEFNLISLSTLHPVTVNSAEQENILDLVQQLYKKRMRHDQILCFVSSTQEVKECCERIKYLTNGSIDAYPLIQAQSAIEQEKNIEQGAVFFSTTVAETSLTFPCLKYVIDTGLINMPVYSLELERTDLKETKAAESNTKQRLGRLGRTQPGEYYALYAYKPGEQRPYPIPQICQTDLVNIEFSLRKSPLKTSLKDFKKYLPDQPDQLYINDAIKQLQRLGILSTSPGEHFTSHGAQIGKLPDFGSLPMSKAVLSALTTNRCGRDLIVLSSILSVLNSSTILKSIPEEYKPPEGDFMTLLNVMNMVLLVRESVSSREFSVDRVCTAKRLSRITHVIKQALRRYTNLEKAFSLSNDFRELAQVRSGKWELIAKALLAGYSDKVYVSLKILQGKTQQFLKYNVATPKSPSNETVAVIDTSSKLRTKNKGPPPASLVLARDVLYLTAVRSTAIISFVGQIESSWIEYRFIRELPLNENEEKKFNDDNILSSAIRQFSQIHIHVSNKTLILRGPSGEVLNAELHIRQQLVTEFKFTLSPIINGHENQNLKRNLTLVTKMPIDLFGPLRWRWEAQHQVKIRTKNNHTNGTVSVTVEGLDSQNQLVYKEFISFSKWLSNCVVIRNPDSGMLPLKNEENYETIILIRMFHTNDGVATNGHRGIYPHLFADKDPRLQMSQQFKKASFVKTFTGSSDTVLGLKGFFTRPV